MLDRLTSLQIFLAVVRRGTFAGAAGELGLSRAMATKHVRALEDHLGVRLFNRTTRVTRLTEAGARYHEQVADLVARLALVEQSLVDDTAGVRGVLTVAAPPLFGALHLAPVVAGFMQAFPAVQVRLVLTDRHVDLVDEGIDVAVSVRELGDSSAIARRLTAVRMTVCASPAYLARRGHPDHPRDLAGHNCLLFAEHPHHLQGEWRFMENGAALDVKVSGDFVSNAGDALRIVAVEGRGLVRLPHYIVAEALAAGRLASVLEAYEPPLRPVHALYAHREHQPGKLRSFLDYASVAFGHG